MWAQRTNTNINPQMGNSSNMKTKKYYKDNSVTGLYQQFDPKTGKLKQEGKFQNGQEIGVWKIFDQDGDQQHFTFTKERVGALCHDGTTSSATGRGACSWHGGVAQWLYENVKCLAGGTGKYVPIQKRVQSLKQQIKTKFNINKIGIDLDQEICKLVLLLNQKNSKLIEQVQSANSKVEMGQKQVNIAKEKISYLTSEIKDLDKKCNAQQSELKEIKQKLKNICISQKDNGKEAEKDLLQKDKKGQNIEEKVISAKQIIKKGEKEVFKAQKIVDKKQSNNFLNFGLKQEVYPQNQTQKVKANNEFVLNNKLVTKQTQKPINKQAALSSSSQSQKDRDNQNNNPNQKGQKQSPKEFYRDPQSDLSDWQSDNEQDDDYHPEQKSKDESNEEQEQEENEREVDLIKQLLEKMNLK